MGYSLSFLAVQTPDAAKVLQQLGYIRIGQTCEYAREPLSCYTLPTHWFLIVSRGSNSRLLQPEILASLSENFTVVACSIEEHVMFSSAEYWACGNLVWRAEHIGENGPMHLQTSGVLPIGFEAMTKVHKEAQRADGSDMDDVDHYFDIPLNAAKLITGFKHDEDIPGVDYDSFEVLRKISSTTDSRPWWRFWK